MTTYHKYKIAFYGNNLNQGYNFTELFASAGHEAKLLLHDYYFKQEQAGWWQDSVNTKLIHKFDFYDAFTGAEDFDVRSEELPRLSVLYDYVKKEKFDAIFMMEDGPAVFAGLQGPKKIFISAGYDLQVIPFFLQRLCPWYKTALNLFGYRNERREEYFKTRRFYRGFQERQRAGISECHAVVCSPHQYNLLRTLKYPAQSTHSIPFPVKNDVYSQQDSLWLDSLRDKYKEIDILFFHPTRQFYLKLDRNIYLKDNDKLIYAFAEFAKYTKKRVRLAAVDKGRKEDIAHSKELVRKLNIEHLVEWLPEMSNIQLRSYYALDNVVVCDQYSPSLAIFGSIGREASWYGRLIITAYKSWNTHYFGLDDPPHVFPAITTGEIISAMQRVEQLSAEDKSSRSNLGQQWGRRNFGTDQVIPRFLKLITQ